MRRVERKTLKKEEYDAYLESDEWKKRRKLVMDRARTLYGTTGFNDPKCEWCGVSAAEHCHHLTYERFKHERLSDLVALCPKCHQEAHFEKDIFG